MISAEIRAIKNLVCTELDPTTETLDEFNARFSVLKTERSLQDQPKVKAMVMSANVKRELGFLANNAGSYKNIFCLKSPKFTKPFISYNRSASCQYPSTKPEPTSPAIQPSPTTPAESIPTSRQQPKQQPTTSARQPSPTKSTPTTPHQQPNPESEARSHVPRSNSETDSTPLTSPTDDKFIFINNIFLSVSLLNSPDLKGIKDYFGNIKMCWGDPIDHEGQTRTRIADLSYLQRSLILACRIDTDSTRSLSEVPLITSKKVNFLPKPPVCHCLTMALNFIELLKAGALKRPVTLVTPNSLPQGYISINSDKTSNCAILLKSTYLNLMNKFLVSNSHIFEKVAPSSAYNDIVRVEKVLSHIKKLSSSWELLPAEIYAITSKNSTLPKLRGLCKTHKPHNNHWSSLKFRPIIGLSVSVLSNLAILLDKVLQPMAEVVPFRIKDSFHALNFFQTIDLDQFFIVTFDASSLYTNISLDLAIDAVTFWFEDHEVRALVPQRFHDMLFIVEAFELLFSHNYFTFNGDIYLQSDGLSMGCNAAVSIAELSLGFLESKNNFDPSSHKRYIDDAVDIVRKSEASTEIPRLLSKYNNLDHNINWTCDFDYENPKTVFLDIVIDYSIPGINQYHKPHKKINSFVPFESQHPRHTLRNLPRSLFDRAFTLNTIPHNRSLAFKQIEQGLTILNYPQNIISTCKSQARKIVPTKYIPKTGGLPKKVIYLCLTNNSTNTANPLHADISTLNRILHMDDTGLLNNVHVETPAPKCSYAQQHAVRSAC